MFFDFLLTRYGTVVCDRKQTASGERFWGRQMIEAVTKGLHVGLFNFNTQTINWFDPTEGEALAIWIEQQDAYGTEHKYQAQRFATISKEAHGRYDRERKGR